MLMEPVLVGYFDKTDLQIATAFRCLWTNDSLRVQHSLAQSAVFSTLSVPLKSANLLESLVIFLETLLSYTYTLPFT
jgi:hypothetical protein